MNKFVVFGLLALSLSSAHAQEGVHYFLPRISAVQFDANTGADLTGTIGLFYGYAITDHISAEVEGNMAILGGDFTTSSGTGKTDMWNAGFFGTFRNSLFDADYAYMKAKFGLVYEKLTIESPSSPKKTSSEAVVAFGLGGGYVFENNFTVEVEYVRLKNESHVINAGFHF